MADIAKCFNERCPIKNTCYRYTAISDEFLQVYGNFNFKTDSNGQVTCDKHFRIK